MLPPSSSSDAGSHSGPSSPLPTTSVRAFVFIARITQHFLPSSTRVELLVYTPRNAYINIFFNRRGPSGAPVESFRIPSIVPVKSLGTDGNNQ